MEKQKVRTNQKSSPKTFLGLLFLVLTSFASQAQWSADDAINTPICTSIDYQEDPAIISNSLGGTIIAWSDFRNGNYNIYAQKLDSNGFALWATNGVPICTAVGSQFSPMLVSDGLGGAIIMWQDDRNGINTRVFAQRISTAGAVLWAANGKVLSPAIINNSTPKISGDGTGGAIVVWEDDRTGNGLGDIYAQRITKNGAIVWPPNGAAICIDTNFQSNPVVITDGASGAIISWMDSRGPGGSDIYAQRINAVGAFQWPLNGAVISNASGSQVDPVIVSDGSGGAIVTWFENLSTVPAIKAQRINANGQLQWSAIGVLVYNPFNYHILESIQIVSDNAGGAIISWVERNAGPNQIQDLLAQRINSSGAALWQAIGVDVDGVTLATQIGKRMISDNNGGAIFTWVRASSSVRGVIAQRLNASGIKMWNSIGRVISKGNDKRTPDLASDNHGGAVIVWADDRAVDRDVYAQNIRDNGVLGEVCLFPTMPLITASEDSICLNQKVTLSISGGLLNDAVQWYWYRDLCGGYINPIDSTNAYLIGTGSTITVSAIDTSISTYFVRGEGNCVLPGNCSSISIKVINRTMPKPAITGNLSFCEGNTTNLGTAAYVNYLWSTGATTQNIVVSNSGTYNITVTNAYGCKGMDTATVAKNSKPTVSVTPNSINICPPQTTATLTAGVNASVYSWSPSAGLNQTTGSGIVATPLTTSTYTVTGTSSAGCSATATVNVILAPKPLNIKVTNITATSAKVNWALVNCAVGYVVAYKLATATTWTLKTNSTNVAFANLTGLLVSSNYQCKVRTKFPNGTYSVYSAMKSFTTPALRMGETVTVNALQVYPNPATDKLTLEFPFTEGDATITVVNALGQTVLAQKNNDAEGSIELNIQNLTEGLYFVTVKNGENTFNSRFVKR